MAKKPLLVPLVTFKPADSDWMAEVGSLLHYVSDNSYWNKDEQVRVSTCKMVEAPNFTAKLTCNAMRSGRSAKYIIWEAEDGRTFPMFITDLVDALPFVVHGVLETEMTFCKRGQNYGIRVFGSQVQDKKKTSPA